MEKYDSYNMENTEQKEFELKETDQQNDQIREMGQVLKVITGFFLFFVV